MPRPKEPWKRERILDAAVAALSEGAGGGVLRVMDVAAAAGVSTGTIHYHFHDIEGVFLGVVERAAEQMYNQRVAAIEPLESIPAKLRALIEIGAPDTCSNELRIMYENLGLMRHRPEFIPMMRAYLKRQVSLYRSVLDAGVAAGDFHPTESLGVISRNLLALEDAYDLYRVLSLAGDGRTARANLISYCRSALGIDLDDRDVFNPPTLATVTSLQAGAEARTRRRGRGPTRPDGSPSPCK